MYVRMSTSQCLSSSTLEVRSVEKELIWIQEVDRFNDLDDLFQNDGFKGVYKVRHMHI